jgi:hypothetical protein
MRLLARGPVVGPPCRPILEGARRTLAIAGHLLSFETLFAPVEIALLLGVLELLPRIPVLAARSPVTAAARPGRPVAGALGLGGRLRLLRRVPQLAAREIAHHRIRMLLLDPLECGQQFVALRRAKRSGQAAGDDGPVDKAWRHDGQFPRGIS